MKHFIDLEEYSVDELNGIIAKARDIAVQPGVYSRAAEGKIMSSLFYEPSTRTQLSFAVAMKRLGGQVIGFSDTKTTSVQKGESLKDTAVVVGGYSDIMAIRSPVEGFPAAASLYAGCPVINAGDGGHLHPTQTLTDLLTLSCEKRLSGLTVGICGDLKYGRTVHSLVKSLSRYPDNRFVFVSGEKLCLPGYVREYLHKHNVPYCEARLLREVIPELDVLYMTRIQRERLESDIEYKEHKGLFVLNIDKMSIAKPDLVVLHPLPRNEEIAVEVDDDPRMKFFAQAKYGQYVRMALILHLLDPKAENSDTVHRGFTVSEYHRCGNANCVTHKEMYLPKRLYETETGLVCAYCEAQCTEHITADS